MKRWVKCVASVMVWAYLTTNDPECVSHTRGAGGGEIKSEIFQKILENLMIEDLFNDDFNFQHDLAFY